MTSVHDTVLIRFSLYMIYCTFVIVGSGFLMLLSVPDVIVTVFSMQMIQSRLQDSPLFRAYIYFISLGGTQANFLRGALISELLSYNKLLDKHLQK